MGRGGASQREAITAQNIRHVAGARWRLARRARAARGPPRLTKGRPPGRPFPYRTAAGYRTSGLNLIRCGWSASAPFRRFRSSMYAW